ncbi:helix-turn-helix domain-containing protein [Alistipes timonensis]|uniref:helix-turn-helix domain-containing protein n=1 Tax=Alistipes timonensis TaxID=1465754 RepID=UPI001897B7CE|nr:helix-turn-helix domain-containing protein [Alistipes timonensis]
MDSQQVCEAFSINKQTLKAYRVRGHLAFSSVGGKFFYREQDVAEFLQARTIRKEV